MIGGPQGDAGLTGRKIIVDTYGGMGRHGGGAFSGKDPSKVDRSACYAARWVAKNIVAAGARAALRGAARLRHRRRASRCRSWSTRSAPATVPEARITRAVREVFDLTPRGIITALDLRKPIYSATPAYGHFGRAPETSRQRQARHDAVHVGAHRQGWRSASAPCDSTASRPRRMSAMVEVTWSRLALDSSSNAYVVILQEKGGERLLPIWIGSRRRSRS